MVCLPAQIFVHPAVHFIVCHQFRPHHLAELREADVGEGGEQIIKVKMEMKLC